MFGLKLKSWMEAHLGRPHRQKSTSITSGTSTSTSSSSHPPPSTCSSSHQRRAGAPKDIIISGSSCSSTTNSTTSSSNGSTSTAIGVGAGSLPIVNNSVPNIGGNNNNPVASCNFQQTTTSLLFTATTTVNTSSSSFVSCVAAVGSEPVTGSTSAQQQQEIKIGKYCGDGGGGSTSITTTSQQKVETTGTKDSELDSHSHAPGETDPADQRESQQQQQQHHHQTSSSIIPASGSNNRVSTVSTSVSNSTSILSGGSSFCNSLSSPDTGYSTDGYSPKSVYPALSFSTQEHATNKHSSAASSSSTASKSSYTISSLVSNELLQSSGGESKHTSASCSVQDGLNEHTTTTVSPPALLALPQSNSAGTSDSATKGTCAQHHHNYTSIPENDSTETCSKENQVMMGVGGDDDEGEQRSNKKAIQLELEKKLPPSGTAVSSSSSVKAAADLTRSHSKFSPFSIDFLKRSSSNVNNAGNEEESGGGGSKPSHGRTHRRAESMDARTPSHEDYKPLVDEEDVQSGGNPSSHFMTTIASSSAGAALTTKSIRTSFVLSNSGQLVEFSSYKNAFSICSPRRERTRIKTNPWIIVNNNKSKDVSSGSKSESANNKSTHANAEQCAASASSGSDGETERGKISGGEDSLSCKEGGMMMIPLETVKRVEKSSSGSGSKRANLLEINNKKKNEKEEQRLREEETENFMEDETGIVDHDSDDRSSSAHILYRISSASDSGKGSLVDPETNRNSTESSCLLSEDSTRNSIISQEASGSSCCGRSSSGESISQHHLNHLQHQLEEKEDTLGHASSSCSPSTAAVAATASESCDQKEQQKGHFHQNKNGEQGQRTFRNASVATTDLLVKSASVSVGVGTTGSNKSANKQNPVMVDKETDILSDWATNTDLEDTEDDLETDREGGNNEDNETVTPAPSSPGTDVDRALFSQSSSGTTDIDFGDSSAATQASSTQVFPPSSLLRQQHQHHHPHNGGSGTTYANTNGVCFHNGSSSNNNSQSESCGAENYDHHYHLQQQQQQQQHNLNMNSGTCFPSVVPIVRPVLAAVQQQQHSQDGFSFDLGNNHHLHHHTLQPQHPFQPATMFYPSFPLEDDLLEDDYPQVKQSSGHKGLARGALGFLRKIFKKGACSSQRHSPDSLASSAAGKKSKGRGKSDNNLASVGVGMGSPLLTISEPLSNPRYSAAVLTTKKQMNPTLNGCYFLTPTPNSFRRRSGGTGGGLFGTQSDSNNSGSDSKGSSSTNKQQPKTVKTDIIRLPPQGPLSPQPQSIIQQRATSSSHSSASSSSCSALSSSNNSGIPQPCSTTFLPPVIASSYFPVGSAGGNNGNLIATISQQSNSASNTNNSSTNSSVHSLMSTSTCSGNNRPPSQQQQQQSKSLIPITQNLYANSSSTSQNAITCGTNSRHNSSTNPFTVPNDSNNSVTARSPPPPAIPESPFLNGDGGMGKNQQSRRDIAPPQQSLKGIIPPYESSPRLPTNSTSGAARMNSPCFNNSYSPIHRLVVTGGSHLRSSNPSSNNHFPSGSSSGESPLSIPRYNASTLGGMDNNSNNFATQVINRSHSQHPHPSTSMSQSPLINHRNSPHPQQPYPPPISSSSSSNHQQQHQPASHNNFFASPSPILKNPRYQYITSSNQNSPILNATKRLNGSTTIIMPCSSANNGGGGGLNGPPPLLTTFIPLPSSAASSSSSQRESLINNNSNCNANSTNTITISSGGSVNLNPSHQSSSSTVGGGGGGRQVVSTSLSYNEFENLSKQQHNFSFQPNKNGNKNGTSPAPFLITSPPCHVQQQLLQHQTHHNKTHHHLQQNHYYSSPIVKQRALQHQFEQTLWNNNEGGGSGGGMRPYQNLQQQQYHQQQKAANQNLRFNSFLVRHRQLPQFYHTQWGLQERIYETVDSEDERSSPGRVSDEIGGGEDCEQDLSMPLSSYNQQQTHNNRSQTGGMTTNPRMKHSYSLREGGFFCESNQVNGDDFVVEEERPPTKRSKPKSLSASGRPFPRPVVALPMMPAGTFLSETETRLLEADKESDRKYKRLINEAEALLKEISVEKEKRAAAAAAVGGGSHQQQRDNNSFRLEDCPQSDPLRRKAYDCWALRRLQQELAGCCASPPVLHRSRLNLQSPSTPTLASSPYLSHFQNMGMSTTTQVPPMLSQQVSYTSSGVDIDPNQNSFEF